MNLVKWYRGLQKDVRALVICVCIILGLLSLAISGLHIPAQLIISSGFGWMLFPYVRGRVKD